MVVGFLLRRQGLEARSIWYDEAFRFVLSARPFSQVLSGTAAEAMPPHLLFLVSYIMRPVFVPRAYRLWLVGYLVLAGRAVAEIRPRPMAGILAGAFALSAIVGLPAEAVHRTFPRSPFGRRMSSCNRPAAYAGFAT
jgi:hypothetical protein